MSGPYKHHGPVPGVFIEGTGFLSDREARIANAAYLRGIQQGREVALLEVEEEAKWVAFNVLSIRVERGASAEDQENLLRDIANQIEDLANNLKGK